MACCGTAVLPQEHRPGTHSYFRCNKQVCVGRYHSYRLLPALPHDAAFELNDLLVKERGVPRAQAEAMSARTTSRAARVGLTYNLDKVIATNTRTAHRLIHFAGSQGKQHEMVERLFRAYFTDGLHVGNLDVLADLAAEIGLERDGAREILDSDAYGNDFDNDIELARQLAITGVPFFVFDGKYAVSGAQPVDTFTQALSTTWQEHRHARA
ncbi:MAG TPA: DsbA family oxidoreductase [Jatrophihabitans sp.]|jgi:predicted DsbA family dithiol-disulfide isomerase|uniref:DsbA family oxidoreductase n=1 Tax=Jatrophihabitans sp. TaxID=1932789 RepID=UPI002F121137